MDDKPKTIFKGINGQVELYANKVVIARRGIMVKLTQGLLVADKDIYFSQLAGVKVKHAGPFFNGFIELILSGNLEFQRSLVKQTQSENVVMFTWDKNDEVDDFKRTIEELMQNQRSGVQNQPNTTDEIEKLHKLYQDGALTEKEFQEQKKKLLQDN